MGSIWVIEKNQDKTLAASDTLMGDFPVRKIASIQSFTHLIRIKHSQRPSALVVDAREGEFSIEHADRILSACLPNCPRIYLVLESRVSEIFRGKLGSNSSLYVTSENINSLALSKHMQEILPRNQLRQEQKGHVFIYRDLKLDMNLFQLQILPMEKIHVLPLKEARLLRFFIENTGKCLTRSEIQRAVWDGIKIESRTIDSHISRLRKRISPGEVTIESLYGDGYKMN